MPQKNSESNYHPRIEVGLGLTSEEMTKMRSQIFRYAINMLGNHPNADHEAENIVQETFIKALQNYDSFRKDSALKTWLYRIAKNVARDFARKNKTPEKPDRNILANSDLTDPKIDEEISEAVLGYNRGEKKLHKKILSEKLLSTLSDDDKNLLLQKEVEGLSIKELSELMGLNENTIKTKLFRIRQGLIETANRRKLI